VDLDFHQDQPPGGLVIEDEIGILHSLVDADGELCLAVSAHGRNARAGQKIFVREGCPACHAPPLYTNNKLTLAKGFTPPPDKPTSLDVLPLSVGPDPGLALATRKGTGYYLDYAHNQISVPSAGPTRLMLAVVE